MMITLDFADPTKSARFPRHGWALNSQGVKLLWLPILRLVHEAESIRKNNGVEKDLSRGQWSEIRAFDQATRHLALALRELHRCVRTGSDLDEDKRSISREAASLIPLFVDLNFVYLRRIADHFARACRFALFERADTVPQKYKELRLLVSDLTALQHHKPFCDAVRLQHAFARHSGWFDKLRKSKDEADKLQKGIRDIMEHDPVALTLQHSKVGEEPWQVIVNLGEGSNASFRPNLIPILRDTVADLSDLWTEVCNAAGLQKAEQLWVAPYGDAVLLTGNDDDTTGFWPEI